MKFLYKESSLVDEGDIIKTAEGFADYRKYLESVATANAYEARESSICLPFDDALLKDIIAMKEAKVSSDLKYIVDIGIGGSSLGTKAIYDAIYGYFDMVEPRRYPKIIFADTNDPEFLSKLRYFFEHEIADPEEVIVNVISKSGETVETIVNMEVVMDSLNRRFSNIANRLVVTTDRDSKLWKVAEKNGIDSLEIPKHVGGRYSSLSAVGLFPLAACGIDVEALRQGARNMRDICLLRDAENNPAMLSAAIQFLHYKKGRNINANFFFHPELESLGKWFRQLMAESIGEEIHEGEKTINVGITPTVAIGSIDLHSMGQLYFGGPKDKLFTLVSSEEARGGGMIPIFSDEAETMHGKGIHDKSPAEIMSAIIGGFKKAALLKGLPFCEVVFENISPYSLGEFLQFKMMEIMFLGKPLRVNVFDQPDIELYKSETRRILAKG